MIHSALEGELNSMETVKDEIFGLEIPMHVPGVPDEVLIPKKTWNDQTAYEETAKSLALKFHENFKKFNNASDAIKEAGPVYQG